MKTQRGKTNTEADEHRAGVLQKRRNAKINAERKKPMGGKNTQEEEHTGGGNIEGGETQGKRKITEKEQHRAIGAHRKSNRRRMMRRGSFIIGNDGYS